VVALVATTAPRSDLVHLAFVAALPYSLTASGIALLAGAGSRPWMAHWAACGAVMLAGLFSLNFFWGWANGQRVETAVGTGFADPQLAAQLTQASEKVAPGDSLFVFPYLPV